MKPKHEQKINEALSIFFLGFIILGLLLALIFTFIAPDTLDYNEFSQINNVSKNIRYQDFKSSYGPLSISDLEYVVKKDYKQAIKWTTEQCTILDSLIVVEKNKSAKYKILVDSLAKAKDILMQKQQELYAPITQKYSSFKKRLRIKKVWLNSAVNPWTYEAFSYMHINVRTRHTHGWRRSSSSASITVDASGAANYQGEMKFDYINIVFDNHAFHRVTIKDNPEWLLVKEGDWVECTYTPKSSLNDIVSDKGVCFLYPELFKLDPLALETFGASPQSLLFKKSYVPLYKN